MTELPVIKKEDGIWSLFVDGKPFTMLSAELHNSSASSAEYMEQQVWPYLRGLNVNSVLFPVYWEMIEAVKGEFNFSLVDQLIEQARREKVRLGILWFGLWKNGISSYVPAWMKQDQRVYFRARDREGRAMDVISPFCQAAVQADAMAFGKLMEHLREVDGEAHTVILVQVENEIGLLGSDMDYSEAAKQEYQKEIPESIAALYEKSGMWETAFHEEAPEVFMEYAYASALEKIAYAGKVQYPLPMYVNAWIEKFPWRPGEYPSGGPIARFLPLWKALAPDISACVPDIYTADTKEVCREYAGAENPLLIPEHRRDRKNISALFYAVGQYQTLCFSPFGAEDFLMPPEQWTGIANPIIMKILNIDMKAWECSGTGEWLGCAYQLLGKALDTIYRYRIKGRVHSFIRENEYEKGTVISLTTCDVRIDYLDSGEDTPKASGIILEGEENELYMIGVSLRYTILAKRDECRQLGILEYSEGVLEEDEYIRKRILNGDERYCMMILEKPQLQYVKWYWYE